MNVDFSRASQVVQWVKNPLMQCRRCGFDLWVGKIPLEEGMVTNSITLAWRILWTQQPGGLQSIRSQRVRQD